MKIHENEYYELNRQLRKEVIMWHRREDLELII